MPDCIGCTGQCGGLLCCCQDWMWRYQFPQSLCYGIFQCCCLDIRAAFPCDASRVPITVGVLGCLLIDLKRGGYDCCNAKLYKCCPCFSGGVLYGRKRRGYDEAPLHFKLSSMLWGKRSAILVKDRSGRRCTVRYATDEEVKDWENNHLGKEYPDEEDEGLVMKAGVDADVEMQDAKKVVP